MSNPHDKHVEFDSTEGLLYRALCVLIEQSNGHLEISREALENGCGCFAVGLDEKNLILTLIKGEHDSTH